MMSITFNNTRVITYVTCQITDMGLTLTNYIRIKIDPLVEEVQDLSSARSIPAYQRLSLFTPQIYIYYNKLDCLLAITRDVQYSAILSEARSSAEYNRSVITYKLLQYYWLTGSNYIWYRYK